MPRRLDPDHAVLAIIDWQVRLLGAMTPGLREVVQARAEHLKWMAIQLDLPIIASEQYPRGLGPTIESLQVAHPVEKVCFSAMGAAAFSERLASFGRKQVMVTGMETHICVAQTCLDLAAAGYEVWLVGDACLSRRRLDWQLGIERVRGEGAVVVSTEAALFELIGQAGTGLFKELSQRIK